MVIELIFVALAMGVAVLLAVLLPILSFLRAQSANRLANEMAARVETLERRVAELTRAVRDMPRRAEPPVPPASASTAAVIPPSPASALEVPPPAVVRQPGTSPQPPAPAPHVPLPKLQPVVVNPPEPSEPRPSLDLEQLIGGRWLLYAGIAAVVLGVSYFVKFAFDNGWISEPLRVAGGVAIGLTLIVAGLRFAARGLEAFGQALMGGGIVVFYVSIYAALHFYALISSGPAFGLMVIVTAAGAWLAHQQRAQPIAMLALLGGFATPFLVGGERDVQVVLFTYVAILIAGTAVLARHHGWPLLSAAAYVCTFSLVVMWAFGSYEAEKWLTTELFLTLYVALFGYLLYELLASGERDPASQLAIAALATAPLVYHLASIILLNDRPAPWLLYVVLVTVAGLVVSQRMGAAWLRLLVLILVGLPMLFWLESVQYPRWYTPGVLVTVALYAMHLAAQWEAIKDDSDEPIPVTELVHTQLNGLLLPLTLYVFFEERAAWVSSWAVGALAAWNAGLAMFAQTHARRVKLQFIAISGTLAAITLVLAFDGPVVAVGWVAEGVFLAWLAMRERSEPLGYGSAILLGLGIFQVVDQLGSPPAAGDAAFFNPRGLAAALVIGLLSWLAWRMAQGERAFEKQANARDVLIIVTNILAIVALSAEIHALFVGSELDARTAGEPWQAVDARLAEQVMLSVTWALYAVGLIAVGMRRQYAPARYLGITLLGVTVLKVLANDIAGLDRLYRMMSVLVVGILLLLASYLYQRRARNGGTQLNGK